MHVHVVWFGKVVIAFRVLNHESAIQIIDKFTADYPDNVNGLLLLVQLENKDIEQIIDKRVGFCPPWSIEIEICVDLCVRNVGFFNISTAIVQGANIEESEFISRFEIVFKVEMPVFQLRDVLFDHRGFKVINGVVPPVILPKDHFEVQVRVGNWKFGIIDHKFDLLLIARFYQLPARADRRPWISG